MMFHEWDTFLSFLWMNTKHVHTWLSVYAMHFCNINSSQFLWTRAFVLSVITFISLTECQWNVWTTDLLCIKAIKETYIVCKIVSNYKIKCLDVGNETVIEWMTPFQCPLINPAQKPQGFLWWQQPIIEHAPVTHSRIDHWRSVFNDQFSLKASFYILHTPCWHQVFFFVYN